MLVINAWLSALLLRINKKMLTILFSQLKKSLINRLVLFLLLVVSSHGYAQTITYFHNDISGTPLIAFDAKANVLWTEIHASYGEKINAKPESSKNSIGFHGKPFDNHSHLSYMGARYYDPVLGRFLSVDPKTGDPENIHSFNRYSYANNNPYRYVDPDGHSPLDVAFLLHDLGKLGVAIYSGAGAGLAVADVAMSTIGMVSPVPGTGQALKAVRAMDRGIDAAHTMQRAKSSILANEIAGKAGEAVTRGTLGDNILGEQITFVLSNGRRARPDFITKVGDNFYIVESKTGGARLSPNQKQLRSDIMEGRMVTPVGEKAGAIGLPAGEKMKIDGFIEHRIN
jgi:RHS repeat-associated protein